jgi:hypothetical protein
MKSNLHILLVVSYDGENKYADGITDQTGQTGLPQDPGNYNDFIEVPDIMIPGDPAITTFTLPSPPNRLVQNFP